MTTSTQTPISDRLRGIRKVRVGFRPDITFQKGDDTTIATGTRRQKTPLQRSREDLAKALKEYNISDVLEREIIGEASRLDTLTTMNMPTLAAVMVYLNNYQKINQEGLPEIYPEDFTDEALDSYLDHLMQDYLDPKKETTASILREKDEVRYRYKQTMLRYILKVFSLRRGNQLTTDDLATIGLPLEPEITIGPREEVEEEF